MLQTIRDKKNEADGLASAGFTIIEVLIVLAIAGLILVVVLIAIPQLQRNQRNSARQAILSRMATEISSYAGNNNGKVPTDAAGLDQVYDRYFGCAGKKADAPGATCTVDITNPSTGNPYKMRIASAAAGPAPAPADADTISYQLERGCEGESLVAKTGSKRNYAMWLQLEGSAIACVDNN